MAEVKQTFSQLDLYLPFIMFDPRRLPKDQNLLVSYSDDEWKNSDIMEKISLIFTRGRCCTSLHILLLITFLLSGLVSKNLCLNAINVSKFSAQENIKRNRWKCNKPIDKTIYTTCIFNVCNYQLCDDLHPVFIYLLKLLLILPLSVAYVERLFSKMNLIKTRL